VEKFLLQFKFRRVAKIRINQSTARDKANEQNKQIKNNKQRIKDFDLINNKQIKIFLFIN
jgi:hypothetical protein